VIVKKFIISTTCAVSFGDYGSSNEYTVHHLSPAMSQEGYLSESSQISDQLMLQFASSGAPKAQISVMPKLMHLTQPVAACVIYKKHDNVL